MPAPDAPPHSAPVPPSRPAAPVALVGSGEFLAVMEPVDRELLDGRPSRAVVLPTASAPDGPERFDYWIRLAEAHYARLGVESVPLPVRQREDAHRPDLVAAVEGAGLVYLSGGHPAFLAETLRDSPLLDAVVSAHARGAALAGCSAGAMALGAVADEPRSGRTCAGLGVVPRLAVLPHFERIERWWPGVVERWLGRLGPGQVLVGVDEDTALVGGPSSWVVRGRGRVWVLESDGGRTGHGPDTRLELPG